MARLRSRVRFLKDGDANTSFFHKQAAFRKRKNYIPKLIDGDQIAASQEDKHKVLFGLFGFYEKLLGTAPVRSASLDLQFFHRESLDLSALDTPFIEDEVWDTIKTMPSDRAPGPDGYTGRFYKTCVMMMDI
jgi:hypothetical protein